MPKADLIAGVFLMAFGLLMLFWIIPAQTDQDTGAAVPPDLLPQICAIGITILAAVLTINAARGTTPPGKAPKMTEWAAMAAVLAIILVGAAVATSLYYIIARTRVGMLIRAGSTDRETVSALGVDIGLVFTLPTMWIILRF